MKKDVKVKLVSTLLIGGIFLNIGLTDLVLLGQITKVLSQNLIVNNPKKSLSSEHAL